MTVYSPSSAELDLINVELPSGLFSAARTTASSQTKGVAVLIPGFTGSKEDFFDLQRALAGLGWAVWSYSQRGQPGSPHPDGKDAYRIEDFADDAAAFVSLIRGREGVEAVNLLGHSFGGVVAQNAALNTRLDGLASLTLLCSGPHGWPERYADITAGLALSIALEDLSGLSARDSFGVRRIHESSKESLDAIARIVTSDRDVVDELAALQPSVLVVHGENDDAWPIEWQREMAERLQANYAVIPGAGHLPNEDVPALAAAILDWFWSDKASRNDVDGTQRA